MRRTGRTEAGVSLVEVVMAVALFGSVTAVFGPVLTSSYSATATVADESRALDEIRVAVARIDKELRSAESVTLPAPSSSGPALSFRTYAGSGGAYDVTYRVEEGELVREVDGATSTISEGLVVTSQEFTHTCNPGRPASVSVDLQVRFAEEHDPRSVGTVIAGRNAWC